jgi:hypothetical protein
MVSWSTSVLGTQPAAYYCHSVPTAIGVLFERKSLKQVKLLVMIDRIECDLDVTTTSIDLLSSKSSAVPENGTETSALPGTGQTGKTVNAVAAQLVVSTSNSVTVIGIESHQDRAS